ncbi:hypothetical protein [Brevundimonas pishanensis]|uniref:hypothetical protein n=1 Tax=Brevundimonas pishanensis TaxID=2896315 RepID=UPI001FA6BC9C|nr:hypothetical protein [Brevundimonas pishanensis]
MSLISGRRRKASWAALVAVALGCTFQSAQASIPPTYNILIVGASAEARARSAALSAFMVSHEAYFDRPLELSRSSLQSCVEAGPYASCVAERLDKDAPNAGAPVVIWVEEQGAKLVWNCVGRAGEATAKIAVDIDPAIALFGDRESQSRELRKAVSCIKDAAITP